MPRRTRLRGSGARLTISVIPAGRRLAGTVARCGRVVVGGGAIARAWAKAGRQVQRTRGAGQLHADRLHSSASRQGGRQQPDPASPSRSWPSSPTFLDSGVLVGEGAGRRVFFGCEGVLPIPQRRGA